LSVSFVMQRPQDAPVLLPKTMRNPLVVATVNSPVIILWHKAWAA